MDYASWDYQTPEWASREAVTWPVLPVVFLIVFLMCAFFNLARSYSFAWGFWGWLLLLILLATAILRYQHNLRAYSRPGRLLIGQEGLWLLDSAGVPEKVFDAEIPIQGFFPTSLELLGKMLRIGGGSVDLVPIPAGAEEEIAPYVERLHDLWKNHPAQRDPGAFAVVARRFGDELLVRVVRPPGGPSAFGGCLLSGGLGFVCLMVIATRDGQYAPTPFMEMLAQFCNWLLGVAVLGVAVSMLLAFRRTRIMNLRLHSQEDGLVVLPLEAQAGKVLDATGRLVFQGLTQAQAERVVETIAARQELTGA